MNTMIASLLLLVACAQSPGGAAAQASSAGSAAAPAPDAQAVVRPGLETFLADVPKALRGKRVGLITNHSGIDRSGRLAIDLIASHPDLKLVALLAPEHGIRGNLMNGVKVENETDSRTAAPA
jgi:uncharacterized protein YbbC (DUF1343 family)